MGKGHFCQQNTHISGSPRQKPDFPLFFMGFYIWLGDKKCPVLLFHVIMDPGIVIPGPQDERVKIVGGTATVKKVEVQPCGAKLTSENQPEGMFLAVVR